MLKDRGIEIFQSMPYTHQQNGRAERIIRTIMEKAESMRLQARIPQSWWEFSIEHATHVYNCTPMCHLNWQTPYTLLYGERPSVERLRVFGCEAYVFLPAEVRANKLAPKSELMTYLGNAPGAGGFMFMRSPNNVLFYSTHCIFDEVLFPKCATPVKKSLTRLLDAPPTHHYHKDTIQVPVDEDTPPRRRAKNKGKECQQSAPQPLESPEESSGEEESSEEESSSSEEEEPPTQKRAPPPDPPLEPRQSTRETRVPKKPDNGYGNRHPVEILKDPTGRKGKCMVKGLVPKPIENVPGPSCLIPDKTPPISPTESELDIERGLNFGPGEKDDNYGLEPPQEEEEEDPYGINLMKLCRGGGVKLSGQCDLLPY